MEEEAPSRRYHRPAVIDRLLLAAVLVLLVGAAIMANIGEARKRFTQKTRRT